MPLKLFSFLFLFSLSFPTWSLNFDWSGFTRVESYYQNSGSHNYYGNYHFVLRPEIQVIDGLSVFTRLDLHSLKENTFSSSQNYRQTGLVFIYGENSSQKDLEFHPLVLNLSQFYFDYESEFFKIRLGRAPYHFGLGTTYSASQDPFAHWMSVYNQVALYVEYSKFYFQPFLIHQNTEVFSGLAQIGFTEEMWKLEALYQYSLKDSSSVVEFFGEYEQVNWNIQASFSYAFNTENTMALALETSLDIPSSFTPTKFEIKTGGVVGDFSFHPNYDLALLLWNRQIQTEKNEENFQIAEAQIREALYLSPRFRFSFLNESFVIKPLFIFAYSLDSKDSHYEFDLEGQYNLTKNLFFSMTGGTLYSKKLEFALLTQAVVRF